MPDPGNHSETKHWLLTRRWLTVAPIMLLLWIIGQIDKTHISLIIADKDFLRELSLFGHNEELGGLMSTFFIGYGIAIFLWGFLVDRFGARACAIAGTLCWAAVLFLSSRVGGIREYLFIRLLLGLAEGNLWPVCNALTNRWFPAKEHSRIQAFWVTGSTLGTAIGVPVVTALMLASGWRGALAALSLVSLLPLALFIFLRNSPAESLSISRAELEVIEKGHKTAGLTVRMSFREMLRSGPFWLLAACQVVSATTIYTLVQWIPSYATRFRHLPLKEMAPWLTAGYLIATGVTLLVGYLADLSMQRSLAGLWTCLAFSVLVLPFASPSWSAGMNALLLASLTAVAASTAALNGALMHALVRPEAIARSTGIVWGIANFASAAGPTVFGRLITVMGGEYRAGFFFLGLLNLAGVICYAMLHRITKRDRSPGAVGVSSEQASRLR